MSANGLFYAGIAICALATVLGTTSYLSGSWMLYGINCGIFGFNLCGIIWNRSALR